MPQSITIAAFVFGAVLLLIAIIGGRFKIFGAEVSEVAGRKGRIVAAVAGIVFIAIGLYGSFPSQAPRGSTPRKESSPTGPAPEPTRPPPSVLRPPEIINFDASRPTINPGESVTLAWRVNNAEEVKLDGQTVDPQGTKVVSPMNTMTYQLIAYNKRGDNHRETTVRVNEPPPPAKRLKGYLIVNKNSNIDRIENLRKNDRICATKASAEFLRSSPTLSQYDIKVVTPPEVYEGLQRGICVATFALDRGAADKLFPVGLTQMRLIPFYE